MTEDTTSQPPIAAPKKKMAELAVIHTLALIFLAVLLGAFWDLYGRTHLCPSSAAQITQQTVNANLQALVPEGAGPAVNGPSTGETFKPPQKGDQTAAPSGQGTNAPKPPVGGSQPKITGVDVSAYATCLQHTNAEGACKDCCDCLEGGADLHKACRDACPTTDLTRNTEIIKFDIPSTLGPNGDYSACTSAGTAQACKKCCEGSTTLACGDFKYCRTACNSLGQ